MTRFIVRFYVISHSHKTELLARRKKCSPGQVHVAPAYWQGRKSGAAPGKPACPPLSRLAGAKTAKKHARNPYFPLKLQVLA
jgi:hypothetical protein